MRFKLTDDGRFLELTEATEIELEQLELSLTRRIHNWRFNPRVKAGHWDGYYCYLIQNKYVPAGLWKVVFELCKKYKYPLYFEDLRKIFDDEIDYDEFIEWKNDFFKDFTINSKKVDPYEYQYETVFRILKFRKCAAELATSAGKTLINYMLFAYLLQHNLCKRILFIVPNVSLVIQGYNDMMDYNKGKVDMRMQMIYSGQEDIENSNLVIGTYQSLVKKPKEYFDDFDVVAIDEAHKVKTFSIKDILEKCTNANYRFGLTGTFPKKGALEELTLMSYMGPLVNEVSANFLQTNKYASKCRIKVIELNYAPEKTKQAFYNLSKSSETRKKLYNLETNYIMENESRLNMICNIISGSSKNSLVLFHHVDYGKKIYKRLREISKDRLVYFVAGETDTDLREIYKDKMEENSNVIIVASYGTFSTGINVKNIMNIFLTESRKSEIIVRQTIGRGLRLHKNKDILTIIDFTDNLNYYDKESGRTWTSYQMRHSRERKKIYEEQKFPYETKLLRFN